MDFRGTWTEKYWNMGTHATPTPMSSRGYLRSVTPNGQNRHNWSLYPYTFIEALHLFGSGGIEKSHSCK